MMVLLRSLVYFLFLVLSVIAYGSAILIVGRNRLAPATSQG